MGTKSNAEILKAAYAGWHACKGCTENYWDEFTTDDIELYSLAEGMPGNEFTKARKGREEFRAYLRGLTETMSMNSWSLPDTISEGDRVVGIGRTSWTSKKTGKTFDTPIVIVTRFRDGKICEYQEYYDTAKLADCLS